MAVDSDYSFGPFSCVFVFCMYFYHSSTAFSSFMESLFSKIMIFVYFKDNVFLYFIYVFLHLKSGNFFIIIQYK